MANENAARLRIDADGAEARAMFDGVVKAAIDANARLVASTKTTVAKQRAELKLLQREYASLALNMKRVVAAAEQQVNASQKRITNNETRERRTREREAESALAREKLRAARLEAIKAESEARITRMMMREDKARRQTGDQDQSARGPYGNGRYRSRRADVAFNAVGAARSFAGDIHGQIQGAREARARTETNLNDAFVQAIGSGLNAGEARDLRAQVLAFARQQGIREEDIAPAINEAQTRFAVLSNAGVGMAPGQRKDARRAALGNLLEATRLARLSGNDTTDTARFFGAMQARGMSPEVALAATRQAIAAGFSGAVSLGEVSAQSLGSLSQTVATAQAGVTDPAERERLARENVARFFANLQIQAAVGARVGTAGNRLAGLERYFDADGKTNVLYNRLRENFSGNRAATAELDQMFERRGDRHVIRDELRDPTQFASRMAGLFGGDISAFQNVMGARSRNWSQEAGGRNQVMNAPLVSALANVMAVGPDVLRQRDAIMNSNLDPATLATMGEIRGQEDTTTLVRAQQENRDALRDNSRWIVQLSDRFANWQSTNPFTASAFTALGGALGGGFLSRVGVFQWGGRGAPGIGTPGLPGAVPAAGAGVPGAASGAFGLTGAGAVGGSLLVAAATAAAIYKINDEWNSQTGTTLDQRLNDEEGAYRASQRTERARNPNVRRALAITGLNDADIERGAVINANNGPSTVSLDEASIARLISGWSNAGVQIRLDPHDASHVDSTANAAPGGT